MNDGYQRLAYEIIVKAITDWRRIKSYIIFYDADRLEQREFRRIETFFDSSWFDVLAQGVITREEIINRLTETKKARI